MPGIQRLLARYGAADIGTVRAAGVGVAAAVGGESETEERILATIQHAIDKDGAQAILLGSGGLKSHVNLPPNAVSDGGNGVIHMGLLNIIRRMALREKQSIREISLNFSAT